MENQPPMEKRLFLAIALCVGFLVVWTWIVERTKPVPPAPSPSEATIGTASPAAEGTPPAVSSVGVTSVGGEAVKGGAASVGPDGKAPAAAAEPEAAKPADGQAVAGAAEETLVVDALSYTVRLSNKGAHAVSWTLKAYQDAKGAPLDLVAPVSAKLKRFPLDLVVEDAAATERFAQALYRVERREDEEPGGRVTTVLLTWSDGQGNAVEKTLRFPAEGYLVTVEAKASVQGRATTPAIAWGAGFEQEPPDASSRLGGGLRAVLERNGATTPEMRDATKIKVGEPWSEEGGVGWAGLESKYFAAIFIPAGGASRLRAEALRLIEDGREQDHLTMALQPPPGTAVHLFAGPKNYEILQAAGSGLDRLLNYGFFGVIAHPLFAALKFLNGYTHNYGWAIVLLTVGIRLAFFPFMHRSQLKMRVMQEKMKRIQPKMKSLKERYHKLERKEAEKGRAASSRAQLRQEMNEEMMKLYSEEGINPFSSLSGCLPLVAQMPILYGFYTILSISIELRHAPFIFWIKDLSSMDPYYVTPILMGGSMLAQQLMTASSIPDPAQRRMMTLMPIMFTTFFIKMPSGLVLYWLVNNLLGIVQQYLVNREADAQKRAPVPA
jgi:YidC/Oxa1 family membrane protein insertase